jgi:hypothetical protein
MKSVYLIMGYMNFFDTSKSSSSVPTELIPIEYQVFVSIQTENDDQSATTFPILIR